MGNGEKRDEWRPLPYRTSTDKHGGGVEIHHFITIIVKNSKSHPMMKSIQFGEQQGIFMTSKSLAETVKLVGTENNNCK